ncbi:MAG TPA: S-layer homology domain-containing protein, partial [Chloroflexia bacterium]|nr:S-layer homology domain-containing protein [Chloroflexia bacterium]
GGSAPGAGNLISGNSSSGIGLDGSRAMSNTIQGNYIGTDISGTADLGNATDGVIIVGSVNDIVGGTQPGAGNLISGNGGAGIFLLTYGAATIQGNHIGTNISGTAPLGNGSNGVVLADCADCVIGAQTTGGAGGNTIAYNGAVGIAVGEGNTGNSFLSNSIHSNGPLNATTGYSLGLGIDLVELGADGDIFGVTPNDTEDPDTGANDLQNYPVITSTNNNTRIVVGTLNSRPLMTYTLEIFSNSQCDTSGYGEGQTYLGSATAVTGADGNALWASKPLAGYTPGEYLTTTATDEEGSTSEFSACYLVPANNTPTSTSTQTSTGTPTKSSTQVATATATATASTAAGTSTSTANTATPTVCSVSFSDQHPGSSTFYSYVQCLACRGVITGYPDGTFREGSPITRGQIAKVVSNAAGFDEDPGKQIYSDVPPGSTYYEYINRLTRRGIVSGYPCPQRPGSGEGEGQGGAECTPETPGLFKPNENATRGQLSKIVSNAAGFNEVVSGQYYADVPPTGEGSQFYEWVMRLTNKGVMGGYPCGTSDPRSGPCDGQNRPYFRPANEVTRGQAAKIAANTFFPNCVTPARK